MIFNKNNKKLLKNLNHLPAEMFVRLVFKSNYSCHVTLRKIMELKAYFQGEEQEEKKRKKNYKISRSCISLNSIISTYIDEGLK